MGKCKPIFMRVRKVAKSDHYLRLDSNTAPNGRIFMKFVFEHFSKSVEKILVS
jgi:hypothetical protein